MCYCYVFALGVGFCRLAFAVVSFFRALRLALGLVAVVSHRLFLVSRLVSGILVCGGFVFLLVIRVRHTATALLN